jgi:predicted  nucleic acid-binding Zn-ribbon protein
MAKLDSLIRVRRYAVEEKQKALAELYRQTERFEIRRKQFEVELMKEREALVRETAPEMLAYFGRYSQIVKRDLGRIDAELKKLDVRIGMMQDDIRTAFADLKRIEIVHNRRLATERKAQDDKESAEMDAIGIDGFRRNAE